MPERVEDYVGENNPVRFIEAFVDGLDLETAGVSDRDTQFKHIGRIETEPVDDEPLRLVFQTLHPPTSP